MKKSLVFDRGMNNFGFKCRFSGSRRRHLSKPSHNPTRGGRGVGGESPLVGSTLTTVPTHSLQQYRQQTGSRFLTDGCKAFTTQRLSLSLNQIKRSFATTSGLLLKVLDNNWDTDMLKTDYGVERATRECAVLVKAADPAHSYQTGETLRAMLTRLAR